MTDSTVELRLDLFPAQVVVNPGDGQTVHETTRLLVGLDEIWVWKMLNGTPELVVNERYEAISGRRTTGWMVTLDDGTQIKFSRDSGCGCGNPLRGFRPPFQTVQGIIL